MPKSKPYRLTSRSLREANRQGRPPPHNPGLPSLSPVSSHPVPLNGYSNISQPISLILGLPLEITSMIFVYLPSWDLVTCIAVCKSWHIWLQDPDTNAMWVAARTVTKHNLDCPPPPPAFPEWKYAAFLFGHRRCSNCSKLTEKMASSVLLRLTFCSTDCLKQFAGSKCKRFLPTDEAIKKRTVLPVDESVLQEIHFDGRLLVPFQHVNAPPNWLIKMLEVLEPSRLDSVSQDFQAYKTRFEDAYTKRMKGTDVMFEGWSQARCFPKSITAQAPRLNAAKHYFTSTFSGVQELPGWLKNALEIEIRQATRHQKEVRALRIFNEAGHQLRTFFCRRCCDSGEMKGMLMSEILKHLRTDHGIRLCSPADFATPADAPSKFNRSKPNHTNFKPAKSSKPAHQ